MNQTIGAAEMIRILRSMKWTKILTEKPWKISGKFLTAKNSAIYFRIEPNASLFTANLNLDSMIGGSLRTHPGHYIDLSVNIKIVIILGVPWTLTPELWVLVPCNSYGSWRYERERNLFVCIVFPLSKTSLLLLEENLIRGISKTKN